ncbi:unnamed protein product [Caenorhabditis auriculariae]|uniref:Uncharacterized protein n=1 Tax=Caenorhabditis auriculariae TaxID=2777116 RepID=A0A8S1HYM2_9PELO|nr:unnamed protein product [Caenorhabditis auriculariae]
MKPCFSEPNQYLLSFVRAYGRRYIIHPVTFKSNKSLTDYKIDYVRLDDSRTLEYSDEFPPGCSRQSTFMSSDRHVWFLFRCDWYTYKVYELRTFLLLSDDGKRILRTNFTLSKLSIEAL